MLLSYEVASEADHARMADPTRGVPVSMAATGTRATLSDGDELELLSRAAGYDADLRCQALEIRARLWRGDRLVREEEGSLLCTYYLPGRLCEMLEEAGFVDVRSRVPTPAARPGWGTRPSSSSPDGDRDPDDPPRHRPEVPMSQHPRAGQPALPSELVDVRALLRAYDEIRPDPSDPAQRVAFGTSGHRGSAFRAAFNEAHILATTRGDLPLPGRAGVHRPAVHRS